MLPFEFTATPEASPRCMSGGSLMKFGTESNGSSGAEIDCANAEGLSSTQSPTSHGLMTKPPLWQDAAVFDGLGFRPAGGPSIQKGGPARQSRRDGIVAPMNCVKSSA